AYNFTQAADRLLAFQPDLVFLDIALRGQGTGLDLADIINKKYHVPFIFLTSFADPATVKEVVERKPSGYIIKPFKVKDIMPAVVMAMSHSRHKDPGFPALDEINSKMDNPLTRQEYEVLKLLKQGLKYQEVADNLFVSVNTVKTHIRHLYAKLDVSSTALAINKISGI